MYSPTSSLIDPPAHNPIADGVAWAQGAALGSVATSVAVIAAAAIGLLMLSGRLELRRGVTVVLGCFILFGAGNIGAAITLISGVDELPNRADSPAPILLPRKSPGRDGPSTNYDPYAGASVPTAR